MTKRTKTKAELEKENEELRMALEYIEGGVLTISLPKLEEYSKEDVTHYAFAYECLRLHAKSVLNRLDRRRL